MAGNPAEYESRVDGLYALEHVPDPPGYDHLQVFRGTLAQGGATSPVELRAIPARHMTDPLGNAFLTMGRSWQRFATHPNVLELFDWGQTPTPWVLVDGSLDDTLATAAHTLDDEVTCDVVAAVAEALRNAALSNVVHGNLHPTYVHLTGQTVQVDDWGLERVTGTHVSGEFLTPYTAPEQIDPTTHSSGDAIDSYGLAAVAYFGLTGQPPVPPTRDAILGTIPEPPSSLIAVPESVDAFFGDALAKDPQRRPADTSAVATQFRQALFGGEEGGPRAGAAVSGGAGTGSRQPQQQPHRPPQQPQEPTGGQPRQQAGTGGGRTRNQPEQLADRTEQRRRTVLKAGIGATLLGLLGVGAWQFLDDGTTKSEVLDTVPPKADLVAHTNAATLLSNAAFRDALDEQLATQSGAGFGSLSELLDEVQSTTGIDFRQVEDVTGFWGTPESSTNYAAMVLQTPAAEGTVSDRLDAEGVVEREREYRDRPLYLLRSEAFIWDLFLSHLGDGEYVLGTREEIEDVIDVREGELDPVGDDIRDAYLQSAEELVRWGFIVPSGLVEELPSLPGATQLVADLDAGYGSLREEPTGEFRLTVRTSSESVADDFESQVDTLALLASNELESGAAVGLSETTTQQLLGVMEDLEVETDGSDVLVTVPDGFRVVPIVVELLFQ